LDELIRDLDNFATFSGGSLLARLKAIDLDNHSEDDVARLGRALGRRRARGTIVVQALVIDPINSGGFAVPAALVRGLVEGLFVDANGYVRVDPGSLGSLPDLMSRADIDVTDLLRQIKELVEASEASYGFEIADQARTFDAIQSLRDEAEMGELKDGLRDLGFALLTLRPSFLVRLTVLWTKDGGNTRYELEWSTTGGWVVVDPEAGQRLSPTEIGLPLGSMDVIHIPNRTLRIETRPPIRIIAASIVDPNGVELAPDSRGGGLPVDEWFVEFRNPQF
jgi:hypothetical protein